MAATKVHEKAEPHLSESKQEIVDYPPVKLSRWIEKAIIDGHYTAEQIDILRAQKRRVQAVIAAVQNESLSGQQANLTPSRMASQRTSTVIKKSNSLCPIDQVPHNTHETSEPVPVKVADTGEVFPSRPELLAECNYKTCQVCRPISRDRAWQCFNHALLSKTQFSSPEYAPDIRPVSDASHARRLGLWKPRPRPQTFTSFDNIVLTDDEDGSETDTTSLEDGGSGRQSRDSTPTGFRASARRAFQEMMTASRQPSMHNRESKDSSISALTATTQKHKGGVAPTKWTKEKEYKVFGDGETRLSRYARQRNLWRKECRIFGYSPAQRSSFIEATPGKAESGTKKELVVENGVAETEEAIDLGSADIIIQA
ncbi:hypothetical protein MMC26_003286 [Xylographa opegraphella]|nr:hypothetical protein [Xylographa opegraphella]